MIQNYPPCGKWLKGCLGQIQNMVREEVDVAKYGTNSKYGIPNLTENDQIVETSLDKANLLGKVLAKTSSDENYTASWIRMRKAAMELKWKSKSMPNDTLGKINEIFNMQELQVAIKQS